MKLDSHQILQEEEYVFPYHHLVNFSPFGISRTLFWGLEYYAYLSVVLKVLERKAWSSLLEIGCGDGKFIQESAKKFPDSEITGIDYSERAILFAKAFNYGNNARLLCGDIKTLTGQYDVIVLIETLEHIPDSEVPSFMRTIQGLLAQGGRIIVTVPTKNIPLQHKHYRHYDLELLKSQVNMRLLHMEYVVKNTMLRRMLFKIVTKGTNIAWIRRLVLGAGKKYLFAAEENNGRHLVATFIN